MYISEYKYKFFLSFFPPFFILSIRGYNNPRFLTPAYSCLLLFLASALQLFLSVFLSLSLFSLPSLLFFLAHSCSLFPSRVIHSYSSSPHTHIVSLLLSLFLSIVLHLVHLYRDFSSFSPFLTSFHVGLRLSHVKLPSSSFIFLSSLFSSFYFVSPHISPSSFHLASRSCFRFRRFRALLSSSLSLFPFLSLTLSAAHFPLYPSVSLAFCRRTLLSSRSIELRSSGSFYLAQSSYFLRLFFFFFALSFLSSPLSLSVSISSSSPLARSHGILSEHDASCS